MGFETKFGLSSIWLITSNFGGSQHMAQTVAKQGAYGKVKTHRASVGEQLCHFDEIFAALRYKFGGGGTAASSMATGSEAEQFCNKMLGKVSRSFAGVIRQLPDKLQLATCVFYLVLRGLDTIEDDMSAFENRPEEKTDQLTNFHSVLNLSEWSIEGIGEGDEQYLLEHFSLVLTAFSSLPSSIRVIISDITKRMGAGMAEFANKDLKQGTANMEEYNLYCHYVAGLVGEGLSRLWSASGLEDPSIATEMKLADSMGKFLQKVNIIRDYLEDLVEGRAFW
jgi:farnesyl-diphosphate farnesyltransferase